ncbi:MAG: putative sulfate exporter family transporter [bacterium]|nr:putative sulfate exporter family transporter [bacterium]
MIKRTAILLIAIVLLIGVLLGLVSAPIALLVGIIVGLFQLPDEDFLNTSSNIQKFLLQATVVGLGFGINVTDAIEVGSQSLLISLVTIISTFLIAFGIRHLIGSEKKLTMLIASGTAICGGSAIAAISPTIKANAAQTSVALAVIFVLNAIALFIFPAIGRFFHLGEAQYGVLCALAIHDTSSVVGASQSFGEQSVMIATTTKLVRAFWIVPLAVAIGFSNKSEQKSRLPWFMALFIIAVIISSFVPWMQDINTKIVWVSQKLLILVLFLIGLQITIPKLKSLGLKSMIVGVSTWVLLIFLSLFYVINYM